MTALQRRLYKVFFVALLTFCSSLLLGCSSGGFLLQKKDLTTVNNRLAGIENDLWRQSSQISTLLEENRNEQQRLAERIEENARSLENLEDLIKQNHRKTCRKFAAIRKHTAGSDPEIQSSPILESTGTDKLLVGRIEKVRLTPPGRTFHARIDTGATTSSLDARDIETFERDGDDWVRFKIKDPESEDLYEVEKPI
ncbi:MAG: RimK/LysX family protein, partial [Desulfosalsimonas sp.]